MQPVSLNPHLIAKIIFAIVAVFMTSKAVAVNEHTRRMIS